MDEAPFMFRSDTILPPDNYKNGTISLTKGRENAQRDGWDQAVTYRENLGLAGIEPKTYSRGPPGPSGHEVSSRSWNQDRRETHPRNSSNPIDMSLSRNQQSVFPSKQQTSTNALASSLRFQHPSHSIPTNSPFNCKSNPYARSSQKSAYRSTRGTETFLEAGQKQDSVELTRLHRDGLDTNGTETPREWPRNYKTDGGSFNVLPTYTESQSSPRQKARSSRSSPMYDLQKHGYKSQDKTIDDIQLIDHHTQIYKPSDPDHFPIPFEYIKRPQPSGSLTPGIELPSASVHLNNIKGSNSYRESPRNAKGPAKICEAEQRKTFPVLPRTGGSKTSVIQEKKSSFFIDDITRLPKNTRSPVDRNNHTKVSSIERHDHQLMIQGLEHSHHPSPFPQEFYSLPTQPNVDPQNRLSASGQLYAHPLQYVHEVPYPLTSMIYSTPYVNSPALPMPGHRGQIPTNAPHHQHVLQSHLKQPVALLKTSNEPVVKLNVENFPTMPSLGRSAITNDKYFEKQQNARRIYRNERNARGDDVREINERENHSQTNFNSFLVTNSFLASTQNSSTSSRSSFQVQSHPNAQKRVGEPIVSSHSFPNSHPFVSDLPLLPGKADRFPNVDTRTENRDYRHYPAPQDTDLRPFLNHRAKNTVVDVPSEHPNGSRSSDQKASSDRLSSNPLSIEKTKQTEPIHRSYETAKANEIGSPKLNTTIMQSSSAANNHKSIKEDTKDKIKYNKFSTYAAEQNNKVLVSEKTEKMPETEENFNHQDLKNKKLASTNKRKSSMGSANKQSKNDVINVNNVLPKIKETSLNQIKEIEVNTKSKRGRKRKLSSDRMAHLPPSNSENLKGEKKEEEILNLDVSTRGRRRMKSEPEDEYVYEWMYDEFSSEPENDDSEDEDFTCPLQKPVAPAKRRGRLMRRQTPRHHSRRISSSFLDAESLPEDLTDSEKHKNSPERSSNKVKSTAKDGKKLATRTVKLSSPRKINKSRKISSDSPDSSDSNIEQSLQTVRAPKKRVRLSFSDKDEPKESENAKNKVVKRGRKKLRKNILKEMRANANLKKLSNNKIKAKKPKFLSKSVPKTSKSISRPTKTTDANSLLKKARSKRNISDSHPKEAEVPNSPQEETKLETNVKESAQPSTISSLQETVPPPNIPIPQSCEKAFSASTLQEIVKLPSELNKPHHNNSAPINELSLMDLYKGKHKSVSDDHASNLVPNIVIKQTVNNLFGDDLTESEAQALKAANKALSLSDQSATIETPKSHSSLDDTTAKEDVTASDETLIPKTEDITIAKSDPTTLPKKETKVESNPSISSSVTLQSTEEIIKTPKKRGKPSKKILVDGLETDVQVPAQKKIKIEENKNINTSNNAIKLKQKNKVKTETAAESNALTTKPRKGRPPGKKNKVNRLSIEPKIAKKPGRKSLLSTKLSELNKSLPRADLPKTPGRPRINPKLQPRSQTPVLFRPSENNRHVDSPSSSSINPPGTVKSCHSIASSRSSTPIPCVHVKGYRTPIPSQLPPNMKKLTCNSAIGETVLHKAVRHGYMDNILYYLEQGFDVNTKDNAGYTALHEACVRGRVDAARLLLEFGADVNINSEDGTRPIHDAVEYDHAEMTRLLLACGADPMLSKFSGRSIRDMIHGNVMKLFLTGYLAELKPLDGENLENESLKWDVPVSAVLDSKCRGVCGNNNSESGCDILANPPDEDCECDEMEFELFDEEPFNSYFVQPSEVLSRSNYCLLPELLTRDSSTRGDFLLEHAVDVKYAEMKIVLDEIEGNWHQKKVESCVDTSENLVELVSSDISAGKRRLFKVRSDGTVTYVPLRAEHASKTGFYYQFGAAYCEERRVEEIRARLDQPESALNAQQSSSNEPTLVLNKARTASETISTLVYSRSPSHTSQMSTDSEMKLSGVLPLNETGIEETKNVKLHQNVAFFSKIDDTKSLPSNISEANEIYDDISNESNTYVAKPNDEDAQLETSHIQTIDIPPYSPTADLRPPVSADIDPSRALTETENAVLSLTYDTGLLSTAR